MKIKQAFMQTTDVTVNDRLCKDIKRYALDFVNRNDDHIAFFGSGLLGVYRVRWIEQEQTARWFSEICVTDANELRTALTNSGGLQLKNRVGSNPFNLSIIYVAHCVINSKNISKGLKEETLINLFSILHYKYISGLIAHRFPFNSNIQIAMKLYEALNFKFDLKVYKTWGKLIYERSKSATSSRSIHYTTMLTMRDDDAVQYAVTDVQTRIRVTINRLTEYYYRLRDDDARVVSTSSIMVVEDGIALRDLERKESSTRRYIEGVIPDYPTFVRQQALGTINEFNSTANPSMVELTLKYISERYLKDKKIQEFITQIFEFSIEVLTDKGINTNNLALVLDTLKGSLTGARNQTDRVLYLRDNGDKLVRKANKKEPQIPVAAERTSVILYVILRAMTMNHFK